MPIEQVIKKLEMKGYENVHEIGIAHGCYEAKGLNQYGSRVEVYLEPASGKIVKIRKS